MQLSYDPEADAVYISIREAHGQVRSRRVDEKRIIHFDEASDDPIGLEFLFVSTGIDLSGIPDEPEVRTLLSSLSKLVPAA